jgi:F-type H+-transporting ATPase subunit b
MSHNSRQSQGKPLFFFFVLLFSLGLFQVALAAGGHGGGDRSGDLLDLLYRFINFALLCIILFVVIRKIPIKDFFAARTEGIRQRLEDLTKGKVEAEKGYRKIEEKLRKFEEEKAAILDQYRQEGMAEKEKIIAEAKERVKQIIESSELTIKQEVHLARGRLKQEVADLMAQKAKEILEREIKDKDQDRLVDEFIEKVGRIH